MALDLGLPMHWLLVSGAELTLNIAAPRQSIGTRKGKGNKSLFGCEVKCGFHKVNGVSMAHKQLGVGQLGRGHSGGFQLKMHKGPFSRHKLGGPTPFKSSLRISPFHIRGQVRRSFARSMCLCGC